MVVGGPIVSILLCVRPKYAHSLRRPVRAFHHAEANLFALSFSDAA